MRHKRPDSARSGATILVVDDQQEALASVQLILEREGHRVLIAEIRKVDPEVQIVLQTGYSGEKPPREMLHALDIQGYHDKTEGPEKLLLWVDVGLKAHEQLRRAR